jgi:hypothetical protein
VKIENTEVYGFRAAFRSMRNPKDSWARADAEFGSIDSSDHLFDMEHGCHTDAPLLIGPEDLKLAANLIHGGTEHRKFIRLIQVWATWTIPRYVWTEADTYKVGMTRMSCSTMHKLGHKDLDIYDFQDGDVLGSVLGELNELGKKYRDTKNYDLVRYMKKILPEGFLQKADVNFNYETAINIFRQRKNHRLPEWRLHETLEEQLREQSICDWLYQLPHFKLFVE